MREAVAERSIPDDMERYVRCLGRRDRYVDALVRFQPPHTYIVPFIAVGCE